jgi:hypothetical protein
LVLATAAARRVVMLVLAAMAWVENMATAISAADKNVTLVICFLHMVREAEEARLLTMKCGEGRGVQRQYLFTSYQGCANNSVPA